MVPEIQSKTGRISSHFGSFFAFLTLPAPLPPNDAPGENEVLFVKIGARVLDLRLDTSFGT